MCLFSKWSTTLSLHFHFPTAPIPVRNAGFGEGEGIIWLDDVACTGDESALQSCDSLGVGVNNCGHAEDAGVICVQGFEIQLLYVCCNDISSMVESEKNDDSVYEKL